MYKFFLENIHFEIKSKTFVIVIVGVVYRLRTDTTETFMKYVIFVAKYYAIVIWKIRCINKKKNILFRFVLNPWIIFGLFGHAKI